MKINIKKIRSKLENVKIKKEHIDGLWSFNKVDIILNTKDNLIYLYNLDGNLLFSIKANNMELYS